MIKRKIKADIGEKLKNLCESLSERERKKVLIGMLVISAILCGITVTRAFGRFSLSRLAKGTTIWQGCSGRPALQDRQG